MKVSVVGCFLTGLFAALFSVFVDNIIFFFLGVIIGGIIAGNEDNLKPRTVLLLLFYLGSILGFFIHTAIYGSYALLGVLILIVGAPIIILLFFVVAIIVNKLMK